MDLLTPRRAAALLVVVLAGLLLTQTGFSSATFTSRTQNLGTVRAAADWTPPTVSLDDPGSVVSDTVALTARAADGAGAVARVTIERRAEDSAEWATVCTDDTAPYTCSWNTRNVPDGGYALRAIAIDTAGYATTSAVITTVVANNVTVQLGDLADVVRGTIGVAASVTNVFLSTSLTIEYAVADSGSWKNLCTVLVLRQTTCTWNTSALNGEYDVRARSLTGFTTYYSAITTITVDNTAPTVSMVNPGTPLRGRVTLEATASDVHSDLASVAVQRATSPGTAWTTVCTDTEAPFTCGFDTTTVSDGLYQLRAVATDLAGNTTTSTAVTGRQVDNTVSSVSLEDPGAYLAGTVTLRAVAHSTAGTTRVVIQRSPAGAGSWTDVCTAATAPYSCSWNTTTVPNGTFDLRAVLTDGSGKVTTSATVSARNVDNTPLRGLDVQTANGGVAAGRLDLGDTVTYTFSRQVQPGTVTAGWTGDPLAVQLRLRDGIGLGLGSKGDSVDVLRNGAAVQLGLLTLRENYIQKNRTITFNATLSMATVMVDGVARSRVTVTLGAVASGNGQRTVSTGSTMTWAPAAAVLDAGGSACSAAPVTEAGGLDREF